MSEPLYNELEPPIDPELESERRFPVVRQLFLLSLVLGLIFGGAYLPQVIADRNDDTAVTNVAAPISPINNESVPDAIKPISGVTVEAKAAYVWDVREQRLLYSKNPDTPLPLASVTKLMTALLAYELVADDQTVAISDSAVYQDGDSGLRGGEQFTMAALSGFALMTSSNDGAFALAETAGAKLSKQDPASAFVDGMNARAQELGLDNTTFYNPTGLDITTTTPGATGSARDMTFLMEYILGNHPGLLETTQQETTETANIDGTVHDGTNTNLLIGQIPNLIGSKTGYTDLAGGNLVVAYDAGLNRPIIITVLGSSWNGRFSDVQKLIKSVQTNFVTNQ